MHTLHWQKSSYSGDSSNCVTVAASPTGSLHLRESDEPDIIVTTTTSGLHALIRGIKGAASEQL
ncbi:DUF397 domain-containing protein [Streptomyces griseoruber]|uniref:DUF397 domain-containing protein n=1 Tax=Streptomyces griseoruber TaxID=1943 RepID=A0A101SJI5_9ACTN|nr:DUF397 domain-containing protein [Streptomyces griseoruber]KUN75007.1 hypothetical protein AQJ64_44200 [Streptomyces griseoruber]